MNLFNTALLSCLIVAAPFLNAESLPAAPHISVTGTATINVDPDTVKIEFQSIAVEKEASNAKKAVDKQVQLVLSTLKKMGFEQKLLIREDIRLRPEYEYIEKKRTQVGIKATRNLSYQLDDLNKVNDFLQLLTDAKISTIGQINYTLKESSQWQLKARELAVKDSISKAKGLAESYQTSLGKIYSIKYQPNNTQPIMMRAIDSRQSAPSYQHNQIVLKERVEAVFLLADETK